MIRKSFLKPSSLPRRSAPKKKRRSKAEFARIYGSKERVLFVKGLPCIACCLRPSQNVHIETGGTGRKADYTKIVPACFYAHRLLHTNGREWFEKHYSVNLEAAAAETQAAWLAHTEEGK